MNNNRLESLQVLRFIAAFLVVLFHITKHYKNTEYSFLGNIFEFGYSGVDIFFVLSGFIIFYTLDIKNYTPISFLLKRFIRILPPFWALLFLPQLAIMVFNLSDKHPHLLEAGPMLQALFLTYNHQPIGPSWTLSYELFFYFFVFIALLVNKNRKVFLLLFIVPFIGLFYDFTNIGDLKFFTKPIVLEFLIGIIIFKIFKKNIISKPVSILLFAISSLIFISSAPILEAISDVHSPLHYRLFLFGIPAGGIILSLVSLERHFSIKANPKLILLGSASYSLYLIHSFVVSPIDTAAFNFSTNVYIINSISILGALLVTFASVMTYKLVELPILNFLSKTSKKYLTKS